MDKKYINFIVVTALFLIGYSFVISKFYPPSKPPVSTPIPNKLATTPVSVSPAPISEGIQPKIKEITQDIDTDNFIVTYSLTGGYIKNVYDKTYKESLIFHHIGYIPKLYNQQFSFSTPKKNTVVLESKDHFIKKIWEFDGYYIKLTIIANKPPPLMDLFRSSLSTNGLDQRYQEIFYQQD